MLIQPLLATLLLAAIDFSNPFSALKMIVIVVLAIMVVFTVPQGAPLVSEGISKLQSGQQGWMGIISGLLLAAAPLIACAAVYVIWPEAAPDLSKIGDAINGNLK